MSATFAFALTAAFAGSVVDAAACGGATCANPVEYDVFIIGAGMAGVTAARHLVEQAGFDPSRYIVVDANNYIGGRMRKDTFGDIGTTIEWGANWCEGGSAQNPILNLASDYEVDYDVQSFTNWDTYLKKANDNVDPIKHNKVRKQINDARQAFGNCLSGAAETYDVNDANAVDPGYQNALKECGWDPTDALQEGVDWYSSSYAFPDSTDRLGVYNYFYQAPYNSQYYLVVDQDDGIAGLATNQVDDFNLNVQLNTRVDCVDWDDSMVTVHTNQGCYRADIVISTLSVGALTQNQSIFDPSLATVKDMSMNPYNFGVYNKVMCQFPQKFWGNEEFIHIVSEVDPRGYCGFWQNLDLPYFIPGSRILFCTITTEIVDMISTDGKIPATVIDDFVQPLFEAFDVDPSKRNDYECDYYNWKNDPYTFGSYAYWKVGGDIPGFNHFFEPLTNGGSNKVIFGGAASCLDFGERLQGALFSGQDAANAALKELGEITNYDSVCVL